MRQMLNRHLRLAQPDSHPAAVEPRPRQVRIEYESPFDEGSAAVEVASDMGKRVTACRQRDRIILAQLHRALSQPYGFDGLLRAVGYPTLRLAPDVAPRCYAIGSSITRIEFDRPVEQPQRFVVGLSGPLIQARHRA